MGMGFPSLPEEADTDLNGGGARESLVPISAQRFAFATLALFGGTYANQPLWLITSEGRVTNSRSRYMRALRLLSNRRETFKLLLLINHLME